MYILIYNFFLNIKFNFSSLYLNTRIILKVNIHLYMLSLSSFTDDYICLLQHKTPTLYRRNENNFEFTDILTYTERTGDVYMRYSRKWLLKRNLMPVDITDDELKTFALEFKKFKDSKRNIIKRTNNNIKVDSTYKKRKEYFDKHKDGLKKARDKYKNKKRIHNSLLLEIVNTVKLEE